MRDNGAGITLYKRSVPYVSLLACNITRHGVQMVSLVRNLLEFDWEVPHIPKLLRRV